MSLEEALLFSLFIPFVVSTGIGIFWITAVGLEGLPRVLIITAVATTAFSFVFLTPLLYITGKVGYMHTKKELEAGIKHEFSQKKILCILLASIPVVTMTWGVIFYFMKGYIDLF
ncbi:MAG: hypothetical protein K6T73_05495, partial [Candidatus Bathyarchaeota archaeon]|nr:hypothetical protein [Candidatus Bathyarchaeota archaeon]